MKGFLFIPLLFILDENFKKKKSLIIYYSIFINQYDLTKF